MGGLEKAYTKTVKASRSLTDADAALVEAGRTIAKQIDYAVENLEGSDVTKALYLTPHLMNVLKEMLATPKVRLEAGIAPADKGAASKLGKLRAVHNKSA